MRLALTILGVVCALATAPAFAQCRQALVLGLDVSGSVDRSEYRLQLDGVAAALRQPAIREAFLALPANPVHLSVFEWSGPAYQSVLLNWTAITDGAALDRVAAALEGRARAPAPPGTALGEAMRFGAGLLATGPACWKRTLDISGDGKSNFGPHPRDIQAELSGQSLTVNALVIGADNPAPGDRRQVEIAELSSYFRAWVIVGPDSFVETALGYEAYEEAIARKLLRELEGLAVSSAPLIRRIRDHPRPAPAAPGRHAVWSDTPSPSRP